MKGRRMWNWGEALKNVSLWIIAILLVGGVSFGFLTRWEADTIAKQRRIQERAETIEDGAVHIFTPEDVDPVGVIEYAESQRLQLETLDSALIAYRSRFGMIPVGDTWQDALLVSGTLPSRVTFDPLPVDISWRRRRPPPMKLIPTEDSKGALTIRITSGGITLAVIRSGEITAEDQPIPADAALPPTSSRR